MSITGSGQRIMQLVGLTRNNTDLSLPLCEDGRFDCNFTIPVVADAGDSDEFKNDQSDWIYKFQSWTTAVVFTLQKKSGESWVDVGLVSSYGTVYDVGDFEDHPYYAGYLLSWNSVISEGVGLYRVEIVETNEGGEVTMYSRTYCLKSYDCKHSENSVRLEWYINSGIGSATNDTEIIDLTGLNWYSQIRLPKSIFGYPVSTYDVEEIQYSNGEIQNIKDVQEEKYTLTAGSMPQWMHDIIKTYACQSDELLITDYSSNNPQTIIKKSVKRTSSYEPRWSKQSKCAPVTVEFKPAINRLERFRCL